MAGRVRDGKWKCRDECKSLNGKSLNRWKVRARDGKQVLVEKAKT